MALCANAAIAESYLGLTIGAPVPETLTPLTSTLWGDRIGGGDLTPPLSQMCGHFFLTNGQGGLHADTVDGCAGPILRIRAIEPVRQFTDPADARGFKMDTGLDGVSFYTTTLRHARTQFGSEGLVGGLYGQTTPDFIDSYSLAYGLEETDTLAVFTFQLPFQIKLFGDEVEPPAPQTRDGAQLHAIELVSPLFLDLILAQTPTTPSANYAPLSGLFPN